jgi:hypothetical protein
MLIYTVLRTVNSSINEIIVEVIPIINCNLFNNLEISEWNESTVKIMRTKYNKMTLKTYDDIFHEFIYLAPN